MQVRAQLQVPQPLGILLPALDPRKGDETPLKRARKHTGFRTGVALGSVGQGHLPVSHDAGPFPQEDSTWLSQHHNLTPAHWATDTDEPLCSFPLRLQARSSSPLGHSCITSDPSPHPLIPHLPSIAARPSCLFVNIQVC